MAKKYINELQVDGEVVEQPIAEYQQNYKYGASYNYTPPMDEPKISFGEAVRRTLLPTKMVASAQYNMDLYVRSHDENDPLNHIDKDFDPVKTWKDNRLSEDDFSEVAQMTNMEQFDTWKNQRDFFQDAEERLAQSGLGGNAAAFVAQIATDPTTYFGFGSAKMLSKGMAAYKAFGLSGLAAGTAYEALQQATDDTNMRSAADSMISIGAAGVISTALGGAVGAFTSRVANKGMKFEDAALQIVKEVDSLDETVGSTVGAMEVKKDPSLSVIKGFVPRFLAKAYSPLASVLRGQTAKNSETRDIMGQFFGRTIMTEGNYQGVANEVSVVDGLVKLNGITKAEFNALTEAVQKYKASGNILDDDAYRAALSKIADTSDNLDDGTPLSDLANSMLKFSKRIAKESDGMDDFYFREKHFPSMFSKAQIDKNYPVFVAKLNKIVVATHKKLPAQIKRMENKIRVMRDALAKIDDPLMKQRLSVAQSELSRLNLMLMKTPEQLADDSARWAEMFRTGNFTEHSLVSNDITKDMPNHFKNRVFDQKEMLDFLEVNPFKVYSNYSRDVVPHIASHKAFGSSTPEPYVNSYREKMAEKIRVAKTEGKDTKALEKELESSIRDMEDGWNDITGQTNKKYADISSSAFNTSKALKSFSGATGLSSSIFSILPEFGASLIVRGLKGQGAFVKNMTSIGKSAKALNMRKADSKNWAYGMKFSTYGQLSKVMADDFLDYGLRGGNTLSGQASKGASYVNHWSQYTNGQHPVTGWIRDTIRASQQNHFKESIELLAKGKLSGQRKADLAFLGIDESYANGILNQIKKHGEMDENGGFRFATEKWDKDERYLAEKVDNMLIRDNRRISLDPQVGDVPHAFHVPGIELLFQFKSWAVTAGHTYGIAATQRLDAQHLIGVSAFMGWSGVSYMMAEMAKGNEPPTDFDEIMYSAITNSGFFGILPYYGGHALANILFDLESGGARYIQGQSLPDYFTPPVVNKIQSLGGLATPLIDAIDPDQEAEINNKFWKDFMNVTPIPFVKPYIRNELLSDDR